MDQHRFHADPDPDPHPTFNLDADLDPDPDPTLGFTHVGQSEAFFLFYLQHCQFRLFNFFSSGLQVS